VTWHVADVSTPVGLSRLPATDGVVSTLLAWQSADVAEFLSFRSGLKFVAFSSTSAVTKAQSSQRSERDLSARLLEGERRLLSLAPSIETTVLRPTMIYSPRGDGNVQRIAQQLRRFPVFPLVGDGRGLRQPVDARDLGAAAVAAFQSRDAAGATYSVAGGEILSVKEMVQRIGIANGTTPRFVNLPLGLGETVLRVGHYIPGFPQVPAGALGRLTQDLIFDNSPALRDFGYSPRVFLPPRYLQQSN
jgi:nucleoside-diphosphate-sugar epimerase